MANSKPLELLLSQLDAMDIKYELFIKLATPTIPDEVLREAASIVEVVAPQVFENISQVVDEVIARRPTEVMTPVAEVDSTDWLKDSDLTPFEDLSAGQVNMPGEEHGTFVLELAPPAPLEPLPEALDPTAEDPAPPTKIPRPKVDAPAEEVDPFADETDDDEELWGDVEAPEEHPELDYQRANKVMTFEDVKFAGTKDTVTRMYETNSTNVSSIGANIKQSDQSLCTVYTRFKGAPNPYRYGPVTVKRWEELLGEAVRKNEGRQEASVGSVHYNLIKIDAEEGKIKCQRLVEDKWVEVPPKKERTKALKSKYKE